MRSSLRTANFGRWNRGSCGRKRVARPMRLEGIRALGGNRKPLHKRGKDRRADNRPARECDARGFNRA